ncbi:MAG: hypothetical protein OXE99_14810 [Cellvibrionales bacterium]|nr:hypothetical protein [Cellvibrionales bacterium]
MIRHSRFVLVFFLFTAFFPLPANANQQTVLGVTAGVAVAAIAVLAVSGLLYRHKTQWFSESSLPKLPSKKIKQLTQQAAYQVVGTSRLDSKRQGLLKHIQEEIVAIDHPDFQKNSDEIYANAFFDSVSGLVARVFMQESGDIVMTFRGSEKYLDRLNRYAVPNYKAIEWAEEVFNTFGSQVKYTFIGHCAGGGNAMLAAFSVYHASAGKVNLSVVGINSSLPESNDLYMISKDKQEIKTFLNRCVEVYQDVNDPVFRFAGVVMPFTQSMQWHNWYNWDSDIKGALRLRLVNIPEDFVIFDPLAKREKRNFYLDFSWMHQVRSLDTWGHSAVKWFSWLRQYDGKEDQKLH